MIFPNFSQKFFSLQSYLRYRWQAQGATYLHSPFVYQLYQQVVRGPSPYYAFAQIEKLRRDCLHNPQVISVLDFGARAYPQTSRQYPRTVAQIARHSLSSPAQAKLLFRLVNYFQPQVILETGTSLGISTLYMALARLQSQVYTLEGCPETARLAQRHFEAFSAHHIHLTVGPLQETLPRILEKVEELDMVFLDAHHRYEPTRTYFEACLARAHSQTLFVLDDIHWSAEMESAWHWIKAHPRVSLTLDLFDCGLVFLHEDREKSHFTLRF
ncbi:MAG: class I SAM-dependent methyltransferase [Microscillaceae bacterium]